MANKKQKLQERRHKKEIKKRLSIASFISAVLAAIVTAVGAYVAGYKYATALASQPLGSSAPPEVALVAAIPYAIAALILICAAIFLFYKSRKREKSCISESN